MMEEIIRDTHLMRTIVLESDTPLSLHLYRDDVLGLFLPYTYAPLSIHVSKISLICSQSHT